MTSSGHAVVGQSKVCIHQEKITLDDRFQLLSNCFALARVYKYVVLSTMDAQKSGKLNRLLAELGDTRLVSSRWLRAHGYSNSLVARYVGSGWLLLPTRGVYMRRGGRLQWDGVGRRLQVGEGLPLHVGGRFALAMQGHEHYLRLGDAGMITLYGPQPPPGWLSKLSLEQRFKFLGKGPFDLPAVPVSADVSEKALTESGLAWHSVSPGVDALVCSTPERAMLELCDGVSDAALVYEADALMQAMTTLRPQRVGLLLRHCRSIKAKRLFLALAERHRHAWLSHVPLDEVDLGRGKLAAALSRQHPRDLFDVGLLLEDERVGAGLWRTFLVYLTCNPRPAWEMLAPRVPADLADIFEAHFKGMTAEAVAVEALLESRERLLARMAQWLDQPSCAFLRSVENEQPNFSLIELGHAAGTARCAAQAAQPGAAHGGQACRRSPTA